MANSKINVQRTQSRRSTGKGITFSAFAGISSLVAGILLLPIVISVIGPAPYGTWLFLLAAASFLWYLDLGVGMAVVHFLSRARSGAAGSSPDRIVSTAFAWASAAMLGAVVIFLPIALSYSGEGTKYVTPADYRTLVLCALALLLSMAARPMGSILCGAGYLHVERTTQVVGIAIRVAGTLVACMVWRSVTAIAIAETLALLTPTILAWIAVRRRGLARPSLSGISVIELRLMFSYSLGAFSVSMVGAAILQFGTLAIGIFGSPSEVTFFNAAFRIYSSVRQIIGWLTDPFRSVLSRLHVSDIRRARLVLYDLLFVAFASSTMGCVFLMITLPAVLKIWLGDGLPLDDIAVASSTLLGGLILNSLHIPLIAASDAAGRPGAFLPHQLAWLFSYGTLTVFLFPIFGVVGVAIAMTAPLPLVEFAYLARSRDTVRLNFRTWAKRVVMPTMPILVCGLACAYAGQSFLGNPGATLAVGFSFAVLSLGILYLTRRTWSYETVVDALRTEA